MADETVTGAGATETDYVNVAHMIYGHARDNHGQQLQERMKNNLDMAQFNQDGKGKMTHVLSDLYGGPKHSPPRVYGTKLKKRPYMVPEGNWVMNSGLCPAQAEATKRERMRSRRHSQAKRSELTYKKMLRASQ